MALFPRLGNQLSGASPANSGGLFAGLDPRARQRVLSQSLLTLGAQLLGNAGSQGFGAIGPAIGQGVQAAIGGVENERDRALQEAQSGRQERALRVDERRLQLAENEIEREIEAIKQASEVLTRDRQALSRVYEHYGNVYRDVPQMHPLLDEAFLHADAGDRESFADALREIAQTAYALENPTIRTEKFNGALYQFDPETGDWKVAVAGVPDRNGVETVTLGGARYRIDWDRVLATNGAEGIASVQLQEGGGGKELKSLLDMERNLLKEMRETSGATEMDEGDRQASLRILRQRLGQVRSLIEGRGAGAGELAGVSAEELAEVAGVEVPGLGEAQPETPALVQETQPAPAPQPPRSFQDRLERARVSKDPAKRRSLEFKEKIESARAQVPSEVVARVAAKKLDPAEELALLLDAASAYLQGGIDAALQIVEAR